MFLDLRASVKKMEKSIFYYYFYVLTSFYCAAFDVCDET